MLCIASLIALCGRSPLASPSDPEVSVRVDRGSITPRRLTICARSFFLSRYRFCETTFCDLRRLGSRPVFTLSLSVVGSGLSEEDWRDQIGIDA